MALCQLTRSNNPTQKTYVCTSEAFARGDCTREQLGRFILDLPEGKSIGDTSFWAARVLLPNKAAVDPSSSLSVKARGAANDEHSSLAARADALWPRDTLATRQSVNPSPDGILTYGEPIHYVVKKTGYYCVGAYAFISTALHSLTCPSHRTCVLYFSYRPLSNRCFVAPKI